MVSFSATRNLSTPTRFLILAPCFAGTRVPVRALLDYIEGGDTLDECLPKDLARELSGHTVKTVPQAGWASISNGKLLRLIAGSGKFEVFLTIFI